MNRYSPLWSGIVDSSVWALSDSVRVVWVTMLALQDRDHVVRYTAYALGQRAHKSEKEVLEALKVLSEPDRDRVEEQEYEGRRIQKFEDGWLILNGEKYQAAMVKANRREYMRQYMADLRRKNALVRPYKTMEERVEEKQGAGEAEKGGPGLVEKGGPTSVEPAPAYSLAEKLKEAGQ